MEGNRTRPLPMVLGREAAGIVEEVGPTDIHLLVELETSQPVTVISKPILEATTVLFDALGASAAKRAMALDRHWRNARTIVSGGLRYFRVRRSYRGDTTATGLSARSACRNSFLREGP